jgi:hypothetical protein
LTKNALNISVCMVLAVFHAKGIHKKLFNYYINNKVGIRVDNTESLWKIYENISELIRFSDAKATAILATDGVVVGLFFTNITPLMDAVKDRFVIFLPIAFALACIAVSAWQATDCLFPRLSGVTTCDTVFFCDIVKKHKSAQEYAKATKHALSNDSAKLNEELSWQIWQISNVAQYKYKSVKQSISFLVIAVSACILVILLAAWR